VLNAYLQGIPVGWRFFVKHHIFDLLSAHAAANGDAPGADIVKELLRQLGQKYPAMSRSAA
jgi:N-methylhydantoinase B